MRELSLFTGAGGGLLGTHLLGWRPVGYVEWNEYCQRIIKARIEDGILPDAPIFGDIHAFLSEGYARAYTGMVDVITGGFPCQPFSLAGQRKGAADERNGWPATIECLRAYMARKGMWPTPTKSDGTGGPGKGRQENGHSPQLPEVIGGLLNPTWVEWLMGWPLGWTDLQPLAMDKFRQWLEQHGL